MLNPSTSSDIEPFGTAAYTRRTVKAKGGILRLLLSRLESFPAVRSVRQRLRGGTLTGTHLASYLTTGILFLDILLGIVVLAVGDKHGNGIYGIRAGSCATVTRLSQALNYLVNLLGTLLLSASNYCM
jgi:hypothetical protein